MHALDFGVNTRECPRSPANARACARAFPEHVSPFRQTVTRRPLSRALLAPFYEQAASFWTRDSEIDSVSD